MKLRKMVRITQINMELKVGTSGGNTLDKNEKVRCPCMMGKGNRHMSGEDPKVEKLSSHHVWKSLRKLLGRKVMTNLDSIFKSRDITLPTKVRLVKAMVFPVVMYRCESWTVKKAEH